MNNGIAQNTKIKWLTPPGAIVDDAAYTTTALDTAGWSHVDIYVGIGATDIAMAALKVQESDDSGMSSPADITGCVAATSTLPESGATSVLPTADHDNTFHVFSIPTMGRKRYFDLVATAGDGTAGTYLTAFAVLSKGDYTTVNASDRGITQHFIAQ